MVVIKKFTRADVHQISQGIMSLPFKNSRKKCIHPDTHVKKSQPLILITYQQKKKIGAKRKCIELIPIVKLTLQP